MIKSIVSSNQYIITLRSPHLIGNLKRGGACLWQCNLKSLHNQFIDIVESKSYMMRFGRHNTFPSLNVMAAFTCTNGRVFC